MRRSCARSDATSGRPVSSACRPSAKSLRAVSTSLAVAIDLRQEQMLADPRRQHRGIATRRLDIDALRSRKVVTLGQQAGEVHARDRVVGRQLGGARVQRHRLVHLAVILVQRCQRLQRRNEIGFEAQRLHQSALGIPSPADAAQCRTEVAMRQRIVRLNRDGALEGDDGVLDVTVLPLRVPEIVPPACKAGIVLYGLCKGRDRSGQLAQVRADDAQHHPRRRIAGHDCQRLLEIGGRRGKVAHRLQCARALCKNRRARGIARTPSPQASPTVRGRRRAHPRV